MKFIHLSTSALCLAMLAGCGGSISTEPTPVPTQFILRTAKVGDQRVYQYTDVYNDGTIKTYTRTSILTAQNANGSSVTQYFDADNVLVEIDTIDSNHIFSSSVPVAGSTSRICTDGQIRPDFTSPYTIGQTFSGSYIVSCTPDSFIGQFGRSGNITALNSASLNGGTYNALNEKSLITASFSYSNLGTIVSRSYNQTEAITDVPDLGVTLRYDFAVSYTANPPDSYVASGSRVLVSYVNK
jgi:hypothetical protein